MNIKLRFILILLIGVLLSPKLYYAQTNNDYMDLLLFYVDEKYDICFNKAMKYTEKDKTKKDPLPYLYVSKASFEMSRDHKYTNSFPKAYKTAISFAAKYRKKDKEYKFKSDAEDYIDAFKMIIVEDIENYILEGTDATYGKATGLCKKTCDMDPEDYGAKLLYALLCNLTKNKSTAKEYFKLCKPKLEEYKDNKFSLKYMTKSQQFILRFALIEFANTTRKKTLQKPKRCLKMESIYFMKKMNFQKLVTISITS